MRDVSSIDGLMRALYDSVSGAAGEPRDWQRYLNLFQPEARQVDVTPDSLPIISPVTKLLDLTLATGFSGHGFGTSPAASQLAADLVSGAAPIVDPSPYRLQRL